MNVVEIKGKTYHEGCCDSEMLEDAVSINPVAGMMCETCGDTFIEDEEGELEMDDDGEVADDVEEEETKGDVIPGA